MRCRLVFECILDLSEHVVESKAQLAEFGRWGCFGDTLAQITGRDRCCGAHHLIDRLQATPDGPPSAGSSNQRNAGSCEHQSQQHATYGSVHLGQR